MHLPPTILGPLYTGLSLLFCLLLISACGDEEGAENGGEVIRCDQGYIPHPITGECLLDESNHQNNQTDPANHTDPTNHTHPTNQTDPTNQNQQNNQSGVNGGENSSQNSSQNGGEPEAFCHLGMDPASPVECTFFAHSPSMLYRVDPFRQTIEPVRSVPNNLFDIDTHPDGTIYGITTQTLYRLGENDNDWVNVGNMGVFQNANGLCINMAGVAYMTANDVLYIVDLETAAVTTVGSMGSGFNSSGDCVIDKGNRLFMSSSTTFGHDNLVEINASSANANNIGSTGFSQIYGLTAAWNLLIGTTGSGQIIVIDPQTGQGELLFTASQNIEFYGAASTPER